MYQENLLRGEGCLRVKQGLFHNETTPVAGIDEK